MKNAPDRKAAESARNSAKSTASAPNPDVLKAVADIRAALADLGPQLELADQGAGGQRMPVLVGGWRGFRRRCRRAGIMQSQTRVHELRKSGYDLPTTGRVSVADDEGYMHVGVAVYELLAEPKADLATSVQGVQ